MITRLLYIDKIFLPLVRFQQFSFQKIADGVRNQLRSDQSQQSLDVSNPCSVNNLVCSEEIYEVLVKTELLQNMLKILVFT